MAAASNSRLRLHDWPTTPIRAWAHTHARAMELIVDRGPMNAAPHRSGVGSSSARTCRLPAECPLRHRNGDPTTRLQKDLGLVRQRDTPRQCSLVVQAWSAQGNAEGNEVAGDKLLGTSRSPLRPVHIYSGVVVQDDRRRRRATLLKIQRRGVRFRALSYPWTTEHRRPSEIPGEGSRFAYRPARRDATLQRREPSVCRFSDLSRVWKTLWTTNPASVG
jgi:hypothetical protein